MNLVDFAIKVMSREITEQEFSDSDFEKLANNLCNVHATSFVKIFRDQKTFSFPVLFPSKKENIFLMINAPKLIPYKDRFVFNNDKNTRYIVIHVGLSKSPNGVFLQLIHYHVE